MDEDKYEQHERQDWGNHYNYDEETAAELSPDPSAVQAAETERKDVGGTGLGVTGLVFSIMAFFFWPYLFAFLGIVMGVFGGLRGSASGWWAVGLGALVLLFRILAFPFMAIF